EWRGPAYADAGDWARAERGRLAELRSTAVEQLARARLDLGAAAEAVPDLDAHVGEHPWREEGWALLALALYRCDRQGDALAVLRRARARLADELGVEPGPRLATLETDVLRRAAHLDPPRGAAAGVWAAASASLDRVRSSPRARLESTVGLLGSLALSGADGLRAVREQRVAAILAAEELGDPALTARVLGG
ncbi:AfsR/SARP family transcriptional regulator, partial [Angustibacter aerolatus]